MSAQEGGRRVAFIGRPPGDGGCGCAPDRQHRTGIIHQDFFIGGDGLCRVVQAQFIDFSQLESCAIQRDAAFLELSEERSYDATASRYESGAGLQRLPLCISASSTRKAWGNSSDHLLEATDCFGIFPLACEEIRPGEFRRASGAVAEFSCRNARSASASLA